ncbi:hypothetical protein elemo79C_phanotate52 [Flavobacterium phage vB_FspP_elemoA_7-9C]|nr:hypothetical protein elemo79C_phanotate52 [Flavobacterium phage vB_FspP_elemoA_7-9C]
MGTIPPPNDHNPSNQNSFSFGRGVYFQNVSPKVFTFLAYFDVMVFLNLSFKDLLLRLLHSTFYTPNF